MICITTSNGITVSYTISGSGPPLVLVHGSFSDHDTNWQEVRDPLAERFTVHAMARRGRGTSSVTTGHTVEDEAGDVEAILRQIGEPVFLLGHSYGALCALEAARQYPAGVRSLVLYEPPRPDAVSPGTLDRLLALAGREAWDDLVEAFMREVLQMPPEEIAAIRNSDGWAVWTADAHASVNDLRSASAFRFVPDRFGALDRPVLLLAGSESPREAYLTDALAAVLPGARVHVLEGQAHEGMTTAPALFVEALDTFLLAAVRPA